MLITILKICGSLNRSACERSHQIYTIDQTRSMFDQGADK